MSSITSAELNAAFIAERDFILTTQNFFAIAPVVLLIWNYILTFEKEVAFFWKRGLFSGACVLFLANRYLVLVVAIYQSPWWNLHYSYAWQCSVVVYVQAFCQYSQYVVWAAFSCLRVYALQRQWKWAATVVLILSLVTVVNCFANLRFVHISADPAYGCHLRDDMPSRVESSLAIVSRASLVAAEVLVMVITYMEMGHYRHSADIIRAFPKGLTFSSVFYENGRIYFVLATLMNAYYLVTWMPLPESLATNTTLLYFVEFSPQFAEPVIGILVSHFLFGIQEVASARALPSAESLPLVASDGPAEPETISLLQFVRADVDEWIQSESTHPALEACSALPQGDGPGMQGDEGNIEVSDPVQTV